MKGRAVYLDSLPDERRIAALFEDGQLSDVIVDPTGAPDAGPGAIFRARMGRPMKGQGGAIVALTQTENGFLREAKGLAPGAPVLVQVSTVAEPGKAPPVTRRILFKSRYAIVTPGKPGFNISRTIRDEERRVALMEIAEAAMDGADADLGLILRSSAEVGDLDAVADDASAMRALAEAVLGDADTAAPALLVDAPDAHHLAWREWGHPDLLDDTPGCFAAAGVWDALRDALSPRVGLPVGASMYVEPTRALVAVDVNTGPDTSPAAGLKANVAALRALPRALRVRGLAGQIIVDLAPFPKRDRTQLEQVLKSALRAERAEITLAGWTPLGHMELQAKRERQPLIRGIADVLPDL
ncbi:ribonuclease E/G [Oceanibium sediminis]|uniref:ribonuclease E/G n=1 Tax=Oceanibium sediminis TaxID=2026339 RepID=UPI000DD307C2|nr:ribonuclease E/G [Oceanibium sediminis]